MAILDEVLQTLEVQPTGIPTVVRLSQNENGRQIRLTLRGQETNFPAGCVVTIAGTKPDGVVYSATGELDGNVAVINEDTQMTAVSGMWKARVNVIYGGSTIATELIVFEVYADPVDPGSVPSESELNGLVAEAQYWAENARSSAYGSPLVAETAAEMIETDRVYVYTGSETGYTAGHWYYYNGSAWADGGIYNAAAVQTDTTLSVPGMAADAKATGDAIAAEADRVDTLLESKADKNGNYHDMTAGTAEVVLSEVYDTDKTPYKSRRTPYKSRRLMDEIVGGTVAWNQWMSISSIPTATSGGITFTNNSDGSWTLSGTTSSNNAFRNLNYTSGQNNCHLTANHVYYFPKGNASALSVGVRLYNSDGDPSVMSADAASRIFKVNNVGTQSYMRLQVSEASNTNIGTITVKPQLFDLTQMLGSTIADYILALETATEGAGVSLFRSLFPADYYAYNAGEIKSVSGLSARKAVGFNQWDEEWETGTINSSGVPSDGSNTIRSKNFCKIIGGVTYYARTSKTDGGSQNIYYLSMVFYDADKNFISKVASNNHTFTTPANAAYFKSHTNTSTVIYGNTYLNDICINISNTAKNGTYEPYEAHTYPLDSTLTLRGIPKLDSNNNLYFDGDTYASDGTVTRRHGIVTYNGTENWTYAVKSDGTRYRVYTTLAGAAKNNYNIIGTYISGSGTDNSYPDEWCAITNGNANPSILIGVPSTITSVDDWKAYLQAHPLTVVYELATPTTETASPYQAIQACDPDGTEEYVSTTVVPVGHESKYYRDIDAVIPAAPTADGTYVLKCTVSGGVASYSWEV